MMANRFVTDVSPEAPSHEMTSAFICSYSLATVHASWGERAPIINAPHSSLLNLMIVKGFNFVLQDRCR